MRNFVLVATVFALGFSSEASARGASGGFHSVRAHVTKNGTYRSQHYQTNPNSSRFDNWSTKGNVNPFTGKPGTR
jgi:hypothetical protein